MRQDDFKDWSFIDALSYRMVRGTFVDFVESVNRIQNNFNSTYVFIDEVFPDDPDREELKNRFHVRLLSTFAGKNTFMEALFDLYQYELSNKQQETFNKWFDTKLFIFINGDPKI